MSRHFKRFSHLESLESRNLLSATTMETEPNDRQSNADVADFSSGESILQGISTSDDDKDFFRLTVPSTGQVHVEVHSDNGEYPQVEVEDATGQDRFETEPRDGIHSGSFAATAGEQLYFRVRAKDDAAAEYTVNVVAANGAADVPVQPTDPVSPGSDDGTPDQGSGDAPGTPGADDTLTPGSDDGTPDQGSGDAPGTPGADDTLTPGSDDGTPDQGSGDAPGTPGADDTLTPGSDDGTPDQGSGDAPGTPGADDVLTPGSDDGTPDQGSGDAPGTPGADDTLTPGSDDGTPDQGSGDAPGTPGADDTLTPGSDDGTPDQGSGDAPGTPGADDTLTPGSDDGTPDQGSGDAPGTPGADDTLTPGSDDGTPDQGSGDAPGTPGADDTLTPGSDDGTPDQGSGDAPGTPGADNGGATDPVSNLPSSVTESESNDRKSQANAFSLDDTGYATLSGESLSDDDKDFFVFTPAESGVLQISVSSDNGNFAQLEIENAAGVSLFETEPNDGINSGSVPVSGGATYFVRLRSKSDGPATYTAELQLVDNTGTPDPGTGGPTAPVPGDPVPTGTIHESEVNDRMTQANRFALDANGAATLQGESQSDEDKDYFAFTAPADGQLRINVNSPNGNFAQAQVENALGNELFDTEPNDGINNGSVGVNAGQEVFIRMRSKNDAPAEYAVDLVFAAGQGAMAGDADGDGAVGFSDFLRLSRFFGQSDRNSSYGDFDADGNVSFSDFLILSKLFG